MPVRHNDIYMMRSAIIGFDFGLKQIGVAVGEPITASARPLAILKATDGIPQWPQVTSILNEWQPDVVIVGLPLNMDGSESLMCVRTRKFANRLHGRYGVKVELQDERLSSSAARSSLNDEFSLGHARVPHNKIDAIAAAIIVESWFESVTDNEL